MYDNKCYNKSHDTTLADKSICGGGEGFPLAGTGVVVKEGQERLEGDK
jgi:hypothetical protein